MTVGSVTRTILVISRFRCGGFPDQLVGVVMCSNRTNITLTVVPENITFRS